MSSKSFDFKKPYFFEVSSLGEYNKMNDLYFTYTGTNSGYVYYWDDEKFKRRYIFEYPDETSKQDKLKFYEGRDLVYSTIKNDTNLVDFRESTLMNILSLDGYLPPKSFYEWKFPNEEEALIFCYFIKKNRKKYGFINDKVYRELVNIDESDDLETIYEMYKFAETLNDESGYFDSKNNRKRLILLAKKKFKFLFTLLNRVEDQWGVITDGKRNFNEGVDNISGIISIKYYKSDFYNKNIILIGESHANNEHCDENTLSVITVDSTNYIYDFKAKNYVQLESDRGMDIFDKYDESKSKSMHLPTFLGNVIRGNNDLFIDFIFESWYEHTVVSGETEHLDPKGSNLNYFMNDPCLDRKLKEKRWLKNRELCKYHRTYYGDIRNLILDTNYYKAKILNEKVCIETLNNIKAAIEIIDYFLAFLYGDLPIKEHFGEYSRVEKLIKNLPIVNKLVQYFFDKDVKKLKNIFVDFMSNDELSKEIFKSYLHVELYNYYIENFEKEIKNVYESIEKRVGKKFSEIKSKHKPNYEFFMKSKDYDPDIFLNTFILLNDFYVDLFTHLMDVYILSKVFKEMKHKPEFEHGPDEIRNCIILAGEIHINNISKFLDKNKFKLMAIDKGRIHSDEKACRSLKNFPKNWFKDY